MKLKNLAKCYIYSPLKVKKDGDRLTSWKYKDTLELNVQQDISELDINEAGIIEYNRLKIRADYEVNLQKGDGISFKMLETKNNIAIESPKYKVIAMPKIGKLTTYTCEIYHGE